MKSTLTVLTLLTSLLFLQGCAGGLIVIAGTAVAVTSDERSISTQIEDDQLSLAALDKIKDLNIDHHNMRINLITNSGYLLVIGQVNSVAEKEMIETQLNTLTGVNAVYNQLRINRPIGFAQQSKDSWITTKVKSQLTANEHINVLQIKVVTEDGEVFLIGKVKHKSAEIATDIARKVSGVKYVRRVFQIIPEE